MYTVYKTTCLENGKFYIGVHKTDNPNDGYLGSGEQIKRSVKKHGRDKFKKEILLITECAQEAFGKEAELVTEEVVKSHLSYNMKVGGYGGFDYINSSGKCGLNFETRQRARKGKKNSKTHKARIAESMLGNSNTLGLICINDGSINKKIPKGSSIPNGWKKGMIKRGRPSR